MTESSLGVGFVRESDSQDFPVPAFPPAGWSGGSGKRSNVGVKVGEKVETAADTKNWICNEKFNLKVAAYPISRKRVGIRRAAPNDRIGRKLGAKEQRNCEEENYETYRDQ